MQEKGRSMVEMLGVLAIIGVLSVGAMAGYAKAMFKYKLNKQTEQINQIMMALVEYKSTFSDFAPGENIVPLFKKLNALPTEMQSPNSDLLYDVFNNWVGLSRGDATGNKSSYIYFNVRMTSMTDSNHDICRNVLESFKGYAAELYAIGVNSTTSEDINQQDWYYGSQASNTLGHARKIHMLDIQAMQTVCEKCDSNNCAIYAFMRI